MAPSLHETPGLGYVSKRFLGLNHPRAFKIFDSPALEYRADEMILA
jgi:hypothetical protein